jgi:diguanylate cyclase (GGDEF)-like protein/PAS domain S-box-containing protein
MKLFNQLIQWKPSSDLPSAGIQKKLLYHLYENTQKTLVPLLFLTVIFFVFLKDIVPAYIIYSWTFLLIALTLYRLYAGYRYLHNNYSKAYEKWHMKLSYQAYSTALLWGSIIFFIPYIQDSYLSLMAYLFIMGIGSGAASSFSPSKRIIMFYLIILFSPMFFHFIFLGTAVGFVLASAMIIYYFTLHKISKNIRHSLIEAYEQEEKDRKIQSVLHEELDKLSSLFKNAPIGVFYFDLDLKIVDFNEAFTKLYDTDVSQLIGLDLRQLPDQRPFIAIEKTLTEGVQFYSGPYTTIDGRNVWIEAKSSPIINSKGEVLGGIVLVENKTAERKVIDELNYMARYDALTSLANRRHFMEYMHQIIKKREHTTQYSILFYLDLNQFKTINDTMGHSVGDQLLVQVADRLRMLTKEGYNLSRLGGDEFVIVLPFVADSKEDAFNVADTYSYDLKKAFNSAFLVEAMHLHIKCSIGIVIIEPGSRNIEEIVRYADISMYDAKRKGSDTIAYYNLQLDTERKELFSLQHDLHRAIEDHQLKLYYQPIVNIKDDSLQAAEALLRWEHPTMGILTAEEFIPLAAESGLIDDIGWLVIDMACQQISEWKKLSLFLIPYISINIDAKQLQNSHFTEKFFGLLEQYNIQTSEIKLEITENSLIENYIQTQEIIKTLHDRGIRCAIDDFGTGYSSLSYLKKFSFSVLKIDREFIKDILDKPENTFLVESIIYIGKKLGYHIVIEGIETEEQKNLLKEIDDTLQYQGYLFSPALTAEAFQEKFSQ